ncbi:MAG: Type 1 glutamine amidotransferase-like domain-containing protein [Bacilli bacterium]
MKLYLSGGGAGRQNLFAYNSFFNSIDKDKPILYIPLAMDKEKYEECYNWFKREIAYFGTNNFKMIRSSLELSKLNLSNYSSIFIGGGNTYKLLKELKNNSNIEKIKKYLLNDGIIYGGSAGAIIFGKDIDSCNLTDDKLEVNTKGLNLINDYSLLCHYNKKSFTQNKDFLKEYSNKNKLLFLPEEDVLLITDKKIKFIGEKKYCLFINGNYSIHSSANFKKDINR